jgi:glycosyltransferase involved in cell wall biosynthesis
MTLSLVIPVYKNEDSIPDLVAAVRELNYSLGGQLEAVFVVDGSPDRSWLLLSEALPRSGLNARLILLSRNFGSFAAIRAGLEAASGDFFAVMAADLQEPPDLVLRFFNELAKEGADVVIGTREQRDDPWTSRLASQAFWRLYRRFVIPEMPPGGVDMFGCNRRFRDELLQMRESHSSLVAMLFWLGFRRTAISYTRRARQHGKSAWTLRKKVNYLMDSVFAFTDLPNRLLIALGTLGVAVSTLLGIITLVARFTGAIAVPGYAATVLVIAFFAALNLLGLGLVGSYAWRAYENTKARPLAIVQKTMAYGPHQSTTEAQKLDGLHSSERAV